MTPELTVLALSGFLLLAHVLIAASAKTKQYGTQWNMGARDEQLPPMNAIAGRLDRARANFLETYPLAVAALLGVVVAGKADALSAAAAWTWLGARAIYLPLYWAGIPVVRSLVWAIGILALVALLGVMLVG